MSRRSGAPDQPLRPGPALQGAGLAARTGATRLMPPPSRARRPPTRGALLRRRITVRLAKVLLPALALGLLGAVAFWPELDGNGENSRVSFRRTAEPRPEAMRVVNPRYRGMDDQARPYAISADIGQQVGAEEVLDLTEPRGDILLNDGAWVFLEADRGRYDKPGNRLSLAGDVTIYHDNGTMMRTAEAEVELAAGSASGDAPVAAQGPFGTLTSEGFRLTERGAVVVFTGKAHAVLESRR